MHSVLMHEQAFWETEIEMIYKTKPDASFRGVSGDMVSRASPSNVVGTALALGCGELVRSGVIRLSHPDTGNAGGLRVVTKSTICTVYLSMHATGLRRRLFPALSIVPCHLGSISPYLLIT